MERITQIYSGFGWLHLDKLMDKYGLSRARDTSRPCLFFGCYGDTQVLKALQWAEKSKVVIWWSGSDILHFAKQKDLVELVKENSRISHIATVNFIEKDLADLGITYKKVPLFSLKTALFEPSPLGDSIYVYKPGSSVYCPMPLYEKIRKEFKGIHFIEAHSHHAFDEREMLNVYRRSFLSLRFTKHDGLSHTACESGLMGRKILWNGDIPSAINYSSEDDILIKIEDVIKNKYCPFKISSTVKEYMDQGEKWLWV